MAKGDGRCKGNKHKRRCKRRICQPGQTGEECGGTTLYRTRSAGNQGACTSTTSHQGYCASGFSCVACTTDAECVPYRGPDAACLVRATYRGDIKACAGPETCHEPR